MRSATRSQLALHASASVRSTVSVVSALSARSRVRSSAGSSSSSSTKRVQRSSNASCDAMSSSTCTRGGSPASTGCSARMRCANAWRVDTAAPSSSSSASVARTAGDRRRRRAATGSSARRMRSRSSAAAFSVNVTAAISRMGTPRSTTSATTRSTSALVLPEPAPASTNRVSSSAPTIACAGGEVLVEVEERLLDRLRRHADTSAAPACRLGASRSRPSIGPRVRRAPGSRGAPAPRACARHSR